MASSGQLSQALASALGLPGSVGVAAIQMLRAANMITKKGRGTSAAEMTKDDAATILTALRRVEARGRCGDAVRSVEVRDAPVGQSRRRRHDKANKRGAGQARRQAESVVHGWLPGCCGGARGFAIAESAGAAGPTPMRRRR